MSEGMSSLRQWTETDADDVVWHCGEDDVCKWRRTADGSREVRILKHVVPLEAFLKKFGIHP